MKHSDIIASKSVNITDDLMYQLPSSKKSKWAEESTSLNLVRALKVPHHPKQLFIPFLPVVTRSCLDV
jgi:hypothetical protein